MSRLIKMECDGTEILVEVEDNFEFEDTHGLQKLGGKEALKKAVSSFEKVSETIQAYSRSLVNTFKKLEKNAAPHKVTAEFGVKVNGEGNVFVVKSSAEASLKIVAEWNLKKES